LHRFLRIGNSGLALGEQTEEIVAVDGFNDLADFIAGVD